MDQQNEQIKKLTNTVSKLHSQQNGSIELSEDDFIDVLSEEFQKLDNRKQEFLMDGEYLKHIIDLEKKYMLEEEETGRIQLATLLAILGIYPQETAEQDIVLALRDRSNAEIERIIKEIREHIFSIISSENDEVMKKS